MPEKNPNRIVSFFKTKNPDLLVGSVRGDDLTTLIEHIKSAKAQGKGVTFFLWKSRPRDDGQPQRILASITVAVERDQPERDSRPIGRAEGQAPPAPSDVFGGPSKAAEAKTKSIFDL